LQFSDLPSSAGSSAIDLLSSNMLSESDTSSLASGVPSGGSRSGKMLKRHSMGGVAWGRPRAAVPVYRGTNESVLTFGMH
jgi:hypothetical protein